MTNDEIIDVVSAAADGLPIQNRRKNSNDRWLDCRPDWDFNYFDFRVAPFHKAKRVIQVGELPPFFQIRHKHNISVWYTPALVCLTHIKFYHDAVAPRILSFEKWGIHEFEQWEWRGLDGVVKPFVVEEEA
jgi:hypothetical protein